MDTADIFKDGEGLVRTGPPGEEQPAYLSKSALYSLAGLTKEITPDFLADGGITRAQQATAAGQLPRIDFDTSTRIGCPIIDVGKLVCVGLNYHDHAEETGHPAPQEPVLFFKAQNAITGPTDPIVIPQGSEKVDWEIEFAIVLGNAALNLEDEDAARKVIAGYTISNDVSARDFQLERGGQWMKGKSCPTFNPLGPFLRPQTSIEPFNLGLELRVNNTVRQRSNTANMIFNPLYLVWYISQFMALEAGDVINTGTPGGVAQGRPDEPYLKPGDIVELAIDGLGRQRSVVMAPRNTR